MDQYLPSTQRGRARGMLVEVFAHQLPRARHSARHWAQRGERGRRGPPASMGRGSKASYQGSKYTDEILENCCASMGLLWMEVCQEGLSQKTQGSWNLEDGKKPAVQRAGKACSGLRGWQVESCRGEGLGVLGGRQETGAAGT